MKRLLALLMIFSSPVMAKTTEAQTDMICTYHAAMVAESVELMLNGLSYDEAIVKATENVDEMAGAVLLDHLEASLQSLKEGESYLIGQVTGMASQFWLASFQGGHVQGTKATLFQGSYKACLAGSAEIDVATYFLTYYIMLTQILEPESHRT